MRPSSSPSEGSGGEEPGGLFGPLFADPEVERELSDAAVLRAMLDVEGALARAQATVGLIPVGAATAIERACDTAVFDVDELGRRADAAGSPVVPLVRELGAMLPDEARGWVHYGATTQDVLDTAWMLVARRSLRVLSAQLAAAADTASQLTQAHRDTPMIARTLAQAAAPTTFGLKAAGWLVAIDGARGALQAAGAALAVQFGGAAGNLGAVGEPGLAVLADMAAALGLAQPVLPWHTDRGRILGLAAGLGSVCAVLGKIGLDIVLLAQTEVGEVSAAVGAGVARGGSSAMPQKHNMVDAILVRTAAARAPGLVSTLFVASQHEHERAAGGWHSEWLPLRELLSITGGAAARGAAALAGLVVHPDRMQSNLDATGGQLMAEHVAAALAPALGRTAAHEVVARCASAGGSFRESLLADGDVRASLEPYQLDDVLDSRHALGAVGALVERALGAHRADRGSQQ